MILDNLREISLRIGTAARRAGRDPGSVRLAVVTKYASLDETRELLTSGLVQEIGESRVQDAGRKRESLGELAGKVRWRMVGHLQTNKAKVALRIFDTVDSLDSLRLAGALDETLAAEGRTLEVLVQVKVTRKESQHGIAPEDLGPFLKELRTFQRLSARGLMTIAPELEPVEEVRPFFRRARELFDGSFSGVPGAVLSMGMSRDFEIAVEEGATLVRIGSSVFGRHVPACRGIRIWE
ncbi:MAG: YggS family pyridoxal phosphate-dependent enzyme [Elusimicrobia bacterium]|nr:YggS family pyridoxal phosphate-dependent enzyme [Elusimicrobiota bacterium]